VLEHDLARVRSNRHVRPNCGGHDVLSPPSNEGCSVRKVIRHDIRIAESFDRLQPLRIFVGNDQDAFDATWPLYLASQSSGNEQSRASACRVIR
jgi:hypothetical protein